MRQQQCVRNSPSYLKVQQHVVTFDCIGRQAEEADWSAAGQHEETVTAETAASGFAPGRGKLRNVRFADARDQVHLPGIVHFGTEGLRIERQCSETKEETQGG